MRRASDFLEYWPRLYCGVMRLRHRRTKRIVSPKTVICIEGFPRCANSFAVQAFHAANDPEHRAHIATHLHSPAHILECLRRRIPTIVLIREPQTALVSWLALAVQLGKLKGRQLQPENQARRMAYWTQRYAAFYERLLPFKDKFVSASFEETTTDFGAVLRRVNSLFDTDFAEFQHETARVEAIFSNSKVHLSPSSERNAVKESIYPIYNAASNLVARERAEASYVRFIEVSPLL